MKVLAAIAGGVAVLVLLVIAGLGLALHSSAVHNYLLRVAQQKASAQLGVPVHLENFAVHLTGLRLDLYGLTIDGAQPYPHPPLLQVDHIGGSVRVVSILRRKWYLNNIRVDHPVVWAFSGAGGVSNLPKLKPSGNGKIDVFELGVRHVLLDRGVLDYNNKEMRLEAELHGLDFHSSFEPSQQEYLGSLSYRGGDLGIDGFHPLPHDLNVRFEAARGSFHLTQAKVTSGASHLTVSATLEDYSHPRIQAHYDAAIDIEQLAKQAAPILQEPGTPAGVIHISGSVQYGNDPSRTALRNLTVAGDLSSHQLDWRSARLQTRIDDIAAKYSFADGNAAVQDFRAHLLGGQLAATMSMLDVGGQSRSKLSASLRGISLAALERMAIPSAPAGVEKVRLRGVLNADAGADWGKSLNDMAAHARATVDAGLSHRGNVENSPGVIAVGGVIQGTYRRVNQGRGEQQIELDRSYLKTAGNMLTMNGTLGNRSSIAIRFTSSDLGEIGAIASLFGASSSAHPVQPLGLAGSASFAGTLRGSLADPHLTGFLTASQLKLKGTAWRLLRTNVDLSPSSARFANADVEPAAGGSIALNLNTALSKWSFTKTSVFELELHAARLQVADLTKIANLPTPVAGVLQADLQVRGTLLNPGGQGTVSLARAEAYDEPIQSAALVFKGTGEQIQGNLVVHLPAGTLTSVATVQPKERSYELELKANQIHLDRLHALSSRKLETQGVLNLSASGQGSFNDPELEATLEIPHLVVRQQAIAGTTLKVNLAHHLATASLDAQGVGTSLRGQAKVALTGDYAAQATLDTKTIPLAPLAAAYAPAEAAGVSGETELHATLRGPLKKVKLLEVHVDIPTLKLAYNNTVQLASTGAIHLDYKNGVIALDRAAIRGTDTDLQLQATIPVIGKEPISLLLLGTVNLKLASLFSTGLRSSGELRFNINSYGAKANPDVQGAMQIVDANFTESDLPVGLQHGNGTITLKKDRLTIDSFKATVGGGPLSMSGGVVYRPAVQFNLGATAKGIRMLYPQGVREDVDADLHLAGTLENALLGGRVGISDLSFTPSFDLASVLGQVSGPAIAPPTRGFSQNLHLNLAVSSTGSLNPVSRTISVDGTANLQVRGTAAEPVILGRVNVNGGDMIFNGDRFVLNGGTIEFVNPAEIQPVVNLAISTTIQQYNISLHFNGPVDRLRTNYTSDPSLPTADIINLLAFGQTTEANSANPTTPGSQAAESLIASQVSSQITSRISKVAGISQLSIDPILAGGSNQGPPGANITIQQRVTGNLFVTFSTNPASAEEQVIMGKYQLSPRVAVTATRDQNGGVAFDTSIRKTW